MFPTDWAKEKIATLAKHHDVVWVEDLRYDAEDYYSQCRCRARKAAAVEEDREEAEGEDE